MNKRRIKNPAVIHFKDSEEISTKEAGRRGGHATLENKGRDFFSKIGKKGGKRTANLYRELLSEFGKKGGRPRRSSLNRSMEEEGQ